MLFRSLPPIAVEEALADLVLEVANLPAEGRLRDVEEARGATKAELIGDGEEVAKVTQLHTLVLLPNET